MARTKGSGWGGGVMLYQICPKCNKKKVLYQPLNYLPDFHCTACKERFYSEILIRNTYNHENKRERTD
jgi:ssDNA-binding Zn-finger/Zn-ribbon topoisomerase 1